MLFSKINKFTLIYMLIFVQCFDGVVVFISFPFAFGHSKEDLVQLHSIFHQFFYLIKGKQNKIFGDFAYLFSFWKDELEHETCSVVSFH